MGNNIAALEKLSDEELMAAYQLGNPDAFEALYTRHRDKIYGYLAKNLGSRSQADDVFQECFLRMHRFRFRYDRSFPFLPWLFTLCRNSMIDYLRRTPRTTTLPEIEAAPADADSGVLESLRGLPNKEGQIVAMHYLHGYSFEEVASHLKIKPAGARKIASRAVQKLRLMFKVDHE